MTDVKPLINTGWNKVQEYLAAGVYTWTAPDLFNGADYQIGVYIVGGGGSGAAVRYYSLGSYACSACGGTSGKARAILLTVTPGTEYDIVIGAGGVSATSSLADGTVSGNNGGTTSFNGVSVDGGNGGLCHHSSGNTTFMRGADGGQGSDATYNYSFPDVAPAMGGKTWETH